jgi:CRP-like cAMP-binding protein
MRLRTHARTKLLAGLSLFSDCSDRELAEAGALADEVDLAPGHVLVKQGHKGTLLMVIVSGTADVHVGDQVPRTLGPGDVVGEIALIHGMPHSATVTATSTVHALVFSESALSELMHDSPSVSAKLRREAFERLRGGTAAQPDPS